MVSRTDLLHQNQLIHINNHSVCLEGNLVIPKNAKGIVLFIHSNDRSRHRYHDWAVADTLNRSGLATLRFDFLTPDKEQIDLKSLQYRFNVNLLSRKLREMTDWLTQQPLIQRLKIGYFGTNAGAAATKVAAAKHPCNVKTIVAKGSYLDLTGPLLRRIQAPTLLIVGEQDLPTICSSQDTFAQLQSEKQLVMVPGATHLFEESGLEPLTREIRLGICSGEPVRYGIAELNFSNDVVVSL